jgi:RNA polymerase sigma-70 factor (ECF subfamily)
MDSLAAARFPAVPLSKRKANGAWVDVRAEGAAPEASDEALITQLCTGDCEALAVLFQRYARLTRTVASRILGDAAEAEDLVQDLFLFIQRKCAIFDSSKSTARSWIVQMAYHRALDRRRYLKARQFYTDAAVEENDTHAVGTPTSESDYSAEVVFGRNGLEKILSSLSRDQRETLRLHFFEGYTFTEISEKLGQPLGNVRHYYYRALQKLRQQMFANDPQGSTVVLNR